MGASAVLIVFGLFILRLIVLAERQDNAFGRVYGYSVASIFFFHLAINVGMVTGLTPVIGIPLPFFSYGGSSLWGFTILLTSSIPPVSMILIFDSTTQLLHKCGHE